jgi:hypothetical protein
MTDSLLQDEIQGATGTILERARKEPPHWSEDKIQTWDENDFRRLEPFVQMEYWTDQGSINVFRVVGTQHWDYQGKTWINFLETGKRMDINLGLHAKKPEYYVQTERKKPMMYYVTYDGLSFYVSSDGNHRTGIARFDFYYKGLTMLHGVSINHYHVDWDYVQLCQQLTELCRERAIPATLLAYRESLKREDTAGWKLDHYRTLVKFDDMRHKEPEILDKEGLEEKLHTLSQAKKRRFFNGFFNS